MAVIEPNSEIYLLKSPIELDDANQIDFANADAQFAYFNNLPKISMEKCTYQRRDNIIRYAGRIEDILGYNYCMYRNKNHGNKWFYAYITDMQYLNDEVTAISIKEDSWQTWMFDLTFRQSFVERECVNDDSVGAHTIPENVELGEYVINGTVINNDMSPSSTETNYCWIVMQVTDYPDGNGATNPLLVSEMGGKVYNGVYSGLTYLFFLNTVSANRMIHCYDLAGKSSAIVSIFLAPLGIVQTEDISIINVLDPNGDTISVGTMYDSRTPITVDTTTITKPTTIDGFVPQNNKLYTYPYSYFYVTNNVGSEVPYHYEDFNGNPTFQTDAGVCQGMSIKTYPTNYKRGTGKDGYNFGVVGGKFPTCAWNSDYYVNWCTQNAVNYPLTIASSVTGALGGMVGSAMSGNLLGIGTAFAGGITGIGQAVSRKYEAEITPNQAKGNTCAGDLNLAEIRMGFTFYPMSIKSEYARIVDSFFSMFGYQVNLVKIPNITGRRNWNYVKTNGCNVIGDVPQDAMSNIRNMFDSGITIWHNPSTFRDYSQNNNII